MNTKISSHPDRWIRSNIPFSHHDAHDDDDANNSASNKLSDCSKEVEGRASISMSQYCTLYGPGELETYRHTQLRREVEDAKLRVWYPGSWHRPSSRTYFRAKIRNMQELWKSCNDNDDKDDDDDDDAEEDEMVLLNFRSNARILSAEWIDGAGNGRSQPINPNIHCLRWKSEMATAEEEVYYEHDLSLCCSKEECNIDSKKSNHSDASQGGFLVLELDTSPPPRRPNPMAVDIIVNGESEVHSRGKDEENDHDANNVTTNVESDLVTMPPPCITLQLPSHMIKLDHAPDNQQIMMHRHCLEWEWKNSVGDEEWIPISSCWTLPLQSNIEPNVDPKEMTKSVETNAEASWIFPHQMKLYQLSTVCPIGGHQNTRIDGVDIVDTQDALLCDFGRELLGKVHISIPTLYSSTPPPTVKLRVGETREEAMNDEEEHFEQCPDLDHCHTTNTDNASMMEDKVHAGHVWVSRHLLAFRYVRVIIPTDYHVHVEVTCLAHLPLLEKCGTFSCGDGLSSSNHDYVEQEIRQLQNETNEDLDAKIWNCAAYTLRLCIHNNFIVDGIKRDRLPWVGDLAVSLMANAYTFGDLECIRWTLAVLGRCGMDKLLAIEHSEGANGQVSPGMVSSISGSHVNGIIDYSLWFIISHWLYQRYYGDTHFLQQEWRLIERRLNCLIQFCSNQEEGWLVSNDDDWVFIDWTVNGDKNTALQILWWQALDCGISLAQKMGSLVKESQQQRMKDAISRLENSYLIMEDVQLGFSRQSHALAVLSGLYTRLEDRASEGDWSNPDSSNERWHALRRCRRLYERSREALLGDEMPPVGTPYMKHLEANAIARLGERPFALKVIRSYWGGMLDRNATTFFEAFDESVTLADVTQFYDRPFARSLCHAWAAGPCSLYPEILLGLRPLTDGWEHWVCDPLDCFSSIAIATTIKTKFGIIDVQLDSNNLNVDIPEGTTMILMDKSYSGGRHNFPRKSLISSQRVNEWSKKYRGWHHHSDHVIKPNLMIPNFEGIHMTDVPTVYQLPGDDLFYMSFIAYDGIGYQTFVAESSDLLDWTNSRLAMGYGDEGSFDYGGVVLGAYLYEKYDIDAPRVLKRKNGKFYCLYGAYAKRGTKDCPLYEPDPGYQGLASSTDGLHWQREFNESILSIYGPGMVKDWEKDSIYQPWLVEHEGQYFNFYNAKEMPDWVEQLGLATSNDLCNWTRHEDNPIVRVGKRIGAAINEGYDTQFTSDAKVFWDRDESHFCMFYFGVGKVGAHIMIAYSKDLIHWVRDPKPLYTAGANPSGLDKQYAHKISLVWNPCNETWYMFYCAVGDAGRGIGLITSRSL
mmetsp:Transcript_20908/g.44075  ORF Transcript_20908/g.44075 Transcript_20908/m.44075 type:complete len:1319 (-) Transcript_20908:145-4101(-)